MLIIEKKDSRGRTIYFRKNTFTGKLKRISAWVLVTMNAKNKPYVIKKEY